MENNKNNHCQDNNKDKTQQTLSADLTAVKDKESGAESKKESNKKDSKSCCS